MATKKRFRALLEKHENSEATGITIPFDVPAAFGTRARVPVRGTINRHPFRGTLFPMGGKFIMVVNRQLRADAGVKGGDTISLTLERDDEPRTVTPPPDLARAARQQGRPGRLGQTQLHAPQRARPRRRRRQTPRNARAKN